MKQLFYSLRFLTRGKANNLIKIVSLTLGLVVGLVLFSQVAFEMSYDNFYPDKEHLYRIERKFISSGTSAYEGPVINAPVPGAMRDEFEEVVTATVTTAQAGEIDIVYEGVRFKEKSLITDSLFFDVFGFKVLQGDPRMLGLSENVFLSASAAKRIFGQQNPIGQNLLYSNDFNVTVAGIFEDIPKNSHIECDMLLSIKTLTAKWELVPGWMNNDNYFGYLKLLPGVEPEAVEEKIPAMLYNYYDVDALAERGMSFEYYLNPVTGIHSQHPDIKRMVLILGFLAFSLLFVSAMNYVLISISSLARRAKPIGVHKCNGATSGNIFSMFMYETVVLIVISLVLAFLIILAFAGPIGSLMRTSVSSIFSMGNLWVTILVICVLIFIAGVIPAQIFSAIPVTQVFRTTTSNKKLWKRALLFIQFTGIAFMFTLLVIILRQYHLLINKDLGYEVENVIYSYLWGVPEDKMPSIKQEFERNPAVLSASFTNAMPMSSMNGNMIVDTETNQTLFSARLMDADEDFLDVFRIQMAAGKNYTPGFTDDSRVLVNEVFVEMMHWKDDPVGKTFQSFGKTFEVMGVMKDFQIRNLYVENQPLLFSYMDPLKVKSGLLVLRVNDLNSDLLRELNARLYELTHNEELDFTNYQTMMESQYVDAKMFRNSIVVAAVIMLIITLLGLLGYVEDEISRRSKEIAIRKVNGAQAENILLLIAGDISYIALPGIIIGLLISYIVGAEWLQQFVVKVGLSPFMFLICTLVVLSVLILSVIFRSWHVANENPVKSIKSE